MKYMVVIKAAENQGTPPQELYAAIDELGAEASKAGVQVDMGGLMPSALGVRVRIAGRKLIITDGPFTETKEVIGGFAILEAGSMREAIELTNRFLKIHGDTWDLECEVRPLDGQEFGAGA